MSHAGEPEDMGQGSGGVPARDEGIYVPPALGERRAMGGYYPQYHGGAGLILEALRLGRLEWIRVADPKAGATDDVQIGTPGRVDAYQFKWSQFPGTVTFRDLTRATPESPALIRVLADGWTRLRQLHSGRRVVVHLRTNDQPSVNDAPGAEGGDGGRHFAAFIQKEWIPRTSGRAAEPAAMWAAAWNKLQAASGLTRDEFDRFVRDCRLEFGASLPGPVPAGVAAGAKEEEAYRRDLVALNNQIQQWVMDPRGIVEVSQEELVLDLGWQGRVEFRNVHRFPAASPYREVASTAEAMARALKALPGGYLMLLGTPGSGKSTLLSTALRYRPDRVVHYYAFVPDTPNAHRGESINFLHDIVLELSRGGLKTGRTLPVPDVEILSGQLREQLRAAGDEYEVTGRKTILVVDGLDHIQREQDPVRALLRDLPEPVAIPAGVYVVLGSQTDALPGLPVTVRAQIEQPERRIHMAPLEPGDVVAAVSEAGLQPQPDAGEARRIFDICGGHPLALAYILNRLRAQPGQAIAPVLDEAEAYRGEISVQYLAHWQQIAEDFALVRLLALLARIRGPIRTEWVEGWADPATWNRLRARFGHYFRTDHDGGLRFFHNSFRAFLLERTRGAPGLGGPHGDVGLYAQLADYSRSAAEGSPARWDEIHYLAMGRDVPAVVIAATRAAFSEQFFAGRAPSAILEDIRLAISVTSGTHDEVVLTRLVLLAAEFERRARSLGEVPLEQVLLHLSGPAAALTHAQDDRRLLTSAQRALNLASELQDLGWASDAATLFSLAEPVDVLSGVVPVSGGHGGNVDLLGYWGEVAPRFRPLPTILRAAEQLRAAEGHGSWDRLDPDIPRYRLRLGVLRGLSELDRDADWDEVASGWNPAVDREQHWWFAAHRTAWEAAFRAGRTERARELAGRVTVEFAERVGELGPRQRVALATSAIVLRRDFEAARAWVADLPQPEAVEARQLRGDEGLAPYELRFELNRVLGALGDERPLTEVVPNRDSDRLSLSLLERQVALVGRLWGRAWRGDRLSPASFLVEVRPILRLVRGDPRETGAYFASQARPALHLRLIGAAGVHGPDVVHALRDAFSREWEGEETGKLWQVARIREVLIAFVRQDHAHAAWARYWLERLQPRVFESDGIEERVSEGIAFAEAAAEIGALDLGQQFYQGALASSFGLTGKDYQMSSWVELAARANRADEVSTANRLGCLVGYSALLDAAEDQHDVIEALLRLTCEWDLGAAIRLLEWDIQQGLVKFAPGAAVLLEQALDSDPELATAVSSLVRHIILPLHPGFSSEFLRKLACSVGEQVGDPASEIAKLEHSVLTYALASHRQQLLAELSAARAALGLPVVLPVDMAPPAEARGGSARPTEIELVGEDLTLEAAQQRAVDVEALRDLLRNARPGAFQHWGRVVEPLVAQLDAPSAAAVEELFRDVPESADVSALVARRLADLGEVNPAWLLAERAFKSTRATGWVEFFDSGVRRGAVELMISIDSVRGRALAWRTLTSDLASGSVGAESVAPALPWILDTLSAAPDAVRVWSEVEAYLGALFAYTQPAEPPLLVGDPLGQEACELLLRWMGAYLDHPTMAVVTLVRRAFVELLASDAGSARPAVVSRLQEGTSSEKRAALLVVRSAAEVRPQLVAEMADDLRTIAIAQDHVLRSWARILLEEAGEEVAAREAAAAVVNSALTHYARPDILLPPRGTVRDRPLERGEPLPMATDPGELTGAIEHELDLLARLTGIQREVLQNRAAEMMYAESLDVGSSAGERAVMASVKTAGLDLGSFRRPRAMHARNALFHLLAILEDEGRLDARDLAVFDEVFPLDDPAFLRVQASVRPLSVQPIAERGVSKYPPETWPDLVSTAVSIFHQPEEDGWVFLAECTRLKWLDWKTPTEFRFSVRLPASRAPLLGMKVGPQAQCALLFHELAAAYPTANVEPALPVAFNRAERFDSVRDGWLAFNPTLARELGWTADRETGLFRWRDEAGDVAAETIWWNDGFMYTPPPHFEEEVGTGWLVRVSSRAAAEIETALGPLAGVIQVERTRNESQPRSAVEYLAGVVGGKENH